MIDETHDRARQSWIASANGHAEFPLQNLPFGVFSPPGRNAPDAAPRGGIAIGDMIFDLRAARSAGLFSGEAEAAAIGVIDDHLAGAVAGQEVAACQKRDMIEGKEVWISFLVGHEGLFVFAAIELDGKFYDGLACGGVALQGGGGDARQLLSLLGEEA